MNVNEAAIKNVEVVARRVCWTLGWPERVGPVIMAQFILEKGWEYWARYPGSAQGSDYNFGNAGDPMGGPLPAIASETAGILLYGFVLCISNPAAYAAYWDAARSGNKAEAVSQLASSPWCSPPYGATLLEVYQSIEEGLNKWGFITGAVPSSAQLSSAPSSDGQSASSSRPLTSSSTNTEPTKYQYVVKSGDTMSSIAESRGVPLRLLLRKNPQVSDPNLIEPGEIINL